MSSGLNAEYFNNSGLEGTPLTRVDPNLDFNWAGKDPAEGIPGARFGARWTGFLIPKATGTHTLFVGADDGVRLWVNDVLVINKWQRQSANPEHVAVVELTQGKALALKVEYYQQNGGSQIRLSWTGPSFAKEVIPTTSLSTEQVAPAEIPKEKKVVAFVVRYDDGTEERHEVQ